MLKYAITAAGPAAVRQEVAHHARQGLRPYRVDPARTLDVYRQLKQITGIKEVYQVMGPYDIVAVVEVASLTEVPQVISKSIRGVEGIESTTTCVTFPEPNNG